MEILRRISVKKRTGMNVRPPPCPHSHESHLGLSGYTNWYFLREFVPKVKIQPVFKSSNSMAKPFSYVM